MDAERRELPGGWVAVRDGRVDAVGAPGTSPPRRARSRPTAAWSRRASSTPTTTSTRTSPAPSRRPSAATCSTGCATLYPVWSRLDEEAAYVSAWVGLAELALGGCTTTSDHLYVHPRGGGDLISAEIRAAREVGLRFHATRGSMSLSEKDGGLPPDTVVQEADEILADSERLVALHHDRAPDAMVRVALAPCSPFSVTPELMGRTAELAERLDVRLHTHLAEDRDEDRLLPGAVRLPADRLLRARRLARRPRLGRALRLAERGGDRAPRPGGDRRRALPELEPDPRRRPGPRARAAGRRRAGRHRLRRLRLGRRRIAVAGDPRRAAARPAAQRRRGDGRARRPGDGDARTAPRAWAARARSACSRPAPPATSWPGRWRASPSRARCPTRSRRGCAAARSRARHTVVQGRPVVLDGVLQAPGVEERLADHRRIAGEWLAAATG